MYAMNFCRYIIFCEYVLQCYHSPTNIAAKTYIEMSAQYGPMGPILVQIIKANFNWNKPSLTNTDNMNMYIIYKHSLCWTSAEVNFHNKFLVVTKSLWNWDEWCLRGNAMTVVANQIYAESQSFRHGRVTIFHSFRKMQLSIHALKSIRDIYTHSFNPRQIL